MSYTEFTIEEAKARFQLRIVEREKCFAAIPAVEVSDLLNETLAEGLPLALAISTEKVRDELIVAPVLLEARRKTRPPVSLFSGVEFNVDPSRGLSGVCDFLISYSPSQLTIDSPSVAFVQAKNENIKNGLGQCMAEMVAIREFHKQRGQELPRVYGVVTTGMLWKFLSLEGDVVTVDPTEYPISELGRVVGILVRMMTAEAR